MTTYATDLIRIRKEAGVTAVDLAGALGCSPQYVCRVEHGASLPSDGWAVRALRAMGVDTLSDVGLNHLRLLVDERGHVTLAPSDAAVRLLAESP